MTGTARDSSFRGAHVLRRLRRDELRVRLRINGWLLRHVGWPLHLGQALRVRIVRQELRRLPRPGVLVDIGAGEGTLLRATADLAHVGVGIELHLTTVERARATGVRGVVLGDATAVPLAGHCADVVTATDVIEHVLDDDRVLDELVRLTRPGGYVVITTPTDDFHIDDEYESFDHVRTGYRTVELVERLERRGMEMVRTGYFKTSASRPILRWTRRRSPASYLARTWGTPLLLALLSITERFRGGGYYNLTLVARKP